MVKIESGNFPGGPLDKNSPSNGGGALSIPGQGAKDPTCLGAKKPKTWNRSNIVTNPINTLKMVHIKKRNIHNQPGPIV